MASSCSKVSTLYSFLLIFYKKYNTFSIRDDSVVESYVDCEWTGTNILRRDTLDIPDDSDLIIGYLFSVSAQNQISLLFKLFCYGESFQI